MLSVLNTVIWVTSISCLHHKWEGGCSHGCSTSPGPCSALSLQNALWIIVKQKGSRDAAGEKYPGLGVRARGWFWCGSHGTRQAVTPWVLDCCWQMDCPARAPLAKGWAGSWLVCALVLIDIASCYPRGCWQLLRGQENPCLKTGIKILWPVRWSSSQKGQTTVSSLEHSETQSIDSLVVRTEYRNLNTDRC